MLEPSRLRAQLTSPLESGSVTRDAISQTASPAGDSRPPCWRVARTRADRPRLLNSAGEHTLRTDPSTETSQMVLLYPLSWVTPPD